MAVAAQAQLATATTAVTSDTAGTAGVTSENPQAKTYSCWPQYVQCYSLTTKSHQPVQWGHNLSFPIFRRQTRIRTKHSNAHKSQPMLHMCTEYNSEFFFDAEKNNQTQISVEKVEKGTKLFRQEPTDKGPARWREKANPPPWQGSQEGANPAPDGRTKRHKAHVVAKAKNVYNFFLSHRSQRCFSNKVRSPHISIECCNSKKKSKNSHVPHCNGFVQKNIELIFSFSKQCFLFLRFRVSTLLW